MEDQKNPMIGDINVSPVSVKVDLKGDITQVAQSGAELISSSNKGTGKILNALLGPWMADREQSMAMTKRNNELFDAQTQKDKEDILAGIKILDFKTMKLFDSSEVKQLPLLVSKINQLEDNMRLFKAVAETVKELEATPAEKISDEPLNQDFFNRWRKEAELIDDDELRQLWSHLLAEETKKPKTISVRTLDVVKNLSKEEAKLFQKLAINCVNGVSFVLCSNKKPIIGFLNETVILQDAGLLGEQNLTLTLDNSGSFNGTPAVVIELASSQYILLSKSDKIKMNFYPLTKAGKELLEIANVFYINDEAISISQAISTQNPDVDLVLYKVDSFTENPNGSLMHNFNFNPNKPVWKKNGAPGVK